MVIGIDIEIFIEAMIKLSFDGIIKERKIAAINEPLRLLSEFLGKCILDDIKARDKPATVHE